MRVFKDQAVLVAVWGGHPPAVIAALSDLENADFQSASLRLEDWPLEEDPPVEPGLHVWEGTVTLFVSDEVECAGSWRPATHEDLARIGLPVSFTRELRCRVCGCTEYQPCPGGCALVEPGLCSACAGRGEGLE